MRRFNRWLMTAPLYVQFAFSALTFGLLTYGLDAGLSHHRDSWVGHLIGGLLYGALMTGFFAWRRRKDGGPSQQLALVTALKSGELPPDAEPEVWHPLLDARQRSLRRWRPWAIVEFTAFTGLAVALAVTQGPIWWAFAAFFVGMGVWLEVVGRRTRTRIEALRGTLAQREQQQNRV